MEKLTEKPMVSQANNTVLKIYHLCLFSTHDTFVNADPYSLQDAFHISTAHRKSLRSSVAQA